MINMKKVNKVSNISSLLFMMLSIYDSDSFINLLFILHDTTNTLLRLMALAKA